MREIKQLLRLRRKHYRSRSLLLPIQPGLSLIWLILERWLRHYLFDKHAFVLASNTFLSLQDVAIFSFPGNGFQTGGDQHHVELVNCRITYPPNSHRSITLTGGGFMLDQSHGFIKLENCDFGYSGAPHGEPQALHNAGRLAWGSGLRGEAPEYTGLDVIIVRDGKIAALYVFLDSMP